MSLEEINKHNKSDIELVALDQNHAGLGHADKVIVEKQNTSPSILF